MIKEEYMSAELHPDAPLDEGYWESLGMEGDQARASNPFDAPPPGAGQDPFTGQPGAPTGRSRYEAQWLKTDGGIEFINVFVGESPDSDDKDLLVFLYEAVPGRWNVGLSRPKTTVGGQFLFEDQTYEDAKQLAEEEAGAMSVDAGVNADWRHDPPSAGQLRLIERLDLVPNGVVLLVNNKGEASDLLNVFFSSKTLDPTFAARS